MGKKEQLLMLFENNKGVFFSGEDIAENFLFPGRRYGNQYKS